MGMAGEGVYVTELSPFTPLHGAKWPSPQFRKEILMANYGSSWQLPERSNLANAVIVLFVNRQLLNSVPNRHGAGKVDVRFLKYPEFFEVRAAIKLYDTETAQQVARSTRPRTITVLDTVCSW